jgi:hypothetical protein
MTNDYAVWHDCATCPHDDNGTCLRHQTSGLLGCGYDVDEEGFLCVTLRLRGTLHTIETKVEVDA